MSNYEFFDEKVQISWPASVFVHLIWSVIVVNKSFYIDFLLSIWQEIYLKQMWLTVIGWNCVTW
jgi:hypothetical protein